MGKVIRLNDDVEAWLDTIDVNTNKALKKIRTEFISKNTIPKEEILSRLDDIQEEIRDLNPNR